MPEPLTLPEEFALLSLSSSGKVIDAGQAEVGCAVAELAELALRGRLVVEARKSRVLGLDVHHLRNTTITVLDPTPTGLPWADSALSALATPTAPHKWVRAARRSPATGAPCSSEACSTRSQDAACSTATATHRTQWSGPA
ncbi:GPP34 family phosphoprotein [Amycolatopsis jejuensis]|uniref:GPP34 family phosphoprotein n=1 Tax=Amycolatopsis jejuensis TaxID=330084 RepID=UPI00068E9D1D|nr:GPP34 family phosphoprotein [Amycolatopsis jejuensis]